MHREQAPPDAIYFAAQNAEGLAEILGEWWCALQPGTSVEKEAAALDANRIDVAKFGKRFLSLAKTRFQKC